MRRAASNAALLLAFSVSAGAHQERKFGVVGVLSADGHAALRQAQRKTWIRGVREASAKDKGGEKNTEEQLLRAAFAALLSAPKRKCKPL